MCGRFVSLDPQEMAEVFRVSREMFSETRINYDVRPTTKVASIRLDAQGEREMVGLPWMWKHAKYQHCNAKGESVSRFPAYRDSFAHRRCLVPARGFYEWVPIPGQKKKQRWYIKRTDGALLAFAGIFSEDQTMMATITTMPNAEIAVMHDRTPVSIAPADWERYLDPEPLTDEERRRLLATPPDGTFRLWPVAANAPGEEQIREIDSTKVPPADGPLPTRPRKKASPAGEGDLFS
jgi:putative SOS response-associated peptidase YedK